MSPSARAGKVSRRNFSRALARDKRSWSLWNARPELPIGQSYPWLPMCKRLTPFQASIFLRDNGSRVKKKYCPSWLINKRWGGGSSEARQRSNGHGPLHAKGDYGKRDLKGRWHFFTALLWPTCANCTRNWISPSSWIPLARWRQCWARPQSGLSLSTERYIRLVRIRQINRRSWVIDDI